MEYKFETADCLNLQVCSKPNIEDGLCTPVPVPSLFYIKFKHQLFNHFYRQIFRN